MTAPNSGAARDPEPAKAVQHRTLRIIVWSLLGLIVLRYGLIWATVFTGVPLPHIGTVPILAISTAFSTLHAAIMLGWRRAIAFLAISVVVSWCFETVGVATGLVYGSYHYSDVFGAKFGGVPIIIPFAWFTMLYPSWIVAHLLLEGAGSPVSIGGALARAAVAAMAITEWDTVMDPPEAKAGRWVWEHGGAYFGVPFQNYVGWMETTLAVYIIFMLVSRLMPRQQRAVTTRYFSGAPIWVYAIVALDQVLIAPIPELHLVAAFGICAVAFLAILRLLLGRGPVALPN